MTPYRDTWTPVPGQTERPYRIRQAHPRYVPPLEPDHDVTVHTLALLALVAVPGAVALYFVIVLALAVFGYPLVVTP